MSSIIKEINRKISLHKPEFTDGELSQMMSRCSSYISHCNSLNRPVSDSSLINLWKAFQKERLINEQHLKEAMNPFQRTANAFQIQGFKEKSELYSELSEMVLKHLTERTTIAA
jgi:hypothetical protein